MDLKSRLADEAALVAELVRLSRNSDAVARYLAAIESGRFTHPDGRCERLDVVLLPPQAALLAHLAQRCPARLSIETGFGMGSSTTVILAARRLASDAFEHLTFEPNPRRGALVQSYLEAEFGDSFRRCEARSEAGLGKLLSDRGPGTVGLAFIDGGHHFETVMTDFRLADLLCCEGGYIVFDDAWLPAIESTLNYVQCNRPDYAMARSPMPNTAVLQKCTPDLREWTSFLPFPVAQRENWTASPGGWLHKLRAGQHNT